MNTSTAALAADLRAAADHTAPHNWQFVRIETMDEVSDHAYAASLDLTHVIDEIAAVEEHEGGTPAELKAALLKAAALIDQIAY